MSSATSSKPKSKDPGWEHAFQPDPKDRVRVGCVYCKRIYSGGISRVKLHLAGIKGECTSCPKVDDDVRNKMRLLIDVKKNEKLKKTQSLKEQCDGLDLNHSEGHETDDETVVETQLANRSKLAVGPMDLFCKLSEEEIQKKGKQVKLQSQLTTKLKKEKRDRACEYIAQWFYECSIPHNTVTKQSFQLMVQAIGDYGRDLKIPSQYELSGPLLKKRKEKVQEWLKLHRESWALSGCSIMTDGWTDRKGRGIMNLVVHSSYGVCFLKSIDGSDAKKDGRYIFELVDKCIEEVGENNVVQVITDTARPNETASRLLKAKRPRIFWTGCAAHCIDLMLEDIGKLPNVSKTIENARAVTVFLYAHTRVLELMRRFLGKDLVRSSVTRFATAYLNLKSISDKKSELKKLFRSNELHDLDGDYLRKARGAKASRLISNDRFWSGLDHAINLFEPLVEALRRVDSDVPAMGFLYGDLLDAKKEIALRFDGNESKYKIAWDIIDTRWDGKLKTPLHRAGYYLNPYYYYSKTSEIEKEGIFLDGVTECMAIMYDEEIQDLITEELDTYQRCLESFGRDIARRQRSNKKLDPAKWWALHGTSAPHLKELAKRVLSLTCSSSACERNWSSFEQVHTKKRARLLHGRLNDLVFVKFNSMLQQKRMNKSRDPIEAQQTDVLEDESNEWVRNMDLQVELSLSDEELQARGGENDANKRARIDIPSSSKPNRKKKLILDLSDVNESSSSSDEEQEHVVDEGCSSFD